jgi:hypothetical protein
MLIKKNDEYQEQCKQDYLHELRLEHQDTGTTDDVDYVDDEYNNMTNQEIIEYNLAWAKYGMGLPLKK